MIQVSRDVFEKQFPFCNYDAYMAGVAERAKFAKAIAPRFTEAEMDANCVALADENRARGYSND